MDNKAIEEKVFERIDKLTSVGADKALKRDLQSIIDRNESELKGDVYIATRIKEKNEKILEKTIEKGYKSDAEFTDLIGGKFVCTNAADIVTINKLLQKELQLAHTDDFFIKPNKFGYMSLHTNTVQFNENVEIQIKTKNLDHIQNEINLPGTDLKGAHSLYKDYRKPENTQEKREEIINKSRELYNGAAKDRYDYLTEKRNDIQGQLEKLISLNSTEPNEKTQRDNTLKSLLFQKDQISTILRDINADGSNVKYELYNKKDDFRVYIEKNGDEVRVSKNPEPFLLPNDGKIKDYKNYPSIDEAFKTIIKNDKWDVLTRNGVKIDDDLHKDIKNQALTDNNKANEKQKNMELSR